jgi:MIP family channel proteins
VAKQEWWRPAVAEFLGVLTLVFIGAGTVISLARLNLSVAGVHGGAGGGQDVVVLVGGALAHGFAIAVMVTALGHVSGGHFNPAVTAAALFTKRIRVPLGLIYIAFQVLGGVVGGYLLVATIPANWWQEIALATPLVNEALNVDAASAVLLEAILTFFLVLVVFGVGMDERNISRAVAGLAIGFTITMCILMGAFITGAAINPARAFGTALPSSTWDQHYVYWLGPLLGGIIAGLVYDLAFVQRRAKPAGIPSAPAPEPPAEAEPSPPTTGIPPAAPPTPPPPQ